MRNQYHCETQKRYALSNVMTQGIVNQFNRIETTHNVAASIVTAEWSLLYKDELCTLHKPLETR